MNKKYHLKQYLKMAAQNLYLPAVYALFRHTKIRPGLVVFADAHHDARPENFNLLMEQLECRGGGAACGKGAEEPAGKRACTSDVGKAEKAVHAVGGKANQAAGGGGQTLQITELYLDYGRASFFETIRHMTKFMKLYARAQVVVICDNFLPAASCRKRRQTEVIQLWHACGALKRFGYDTDDDIPADYHGHVFRNIDRVTVSAPFCIKPFASAMRLPKKAIWPVGVCRTDRYFKPGWEESARERFFAENPQLKGKKIVLWAPTFRGSAGDPECISLDRRALSEQLGAQWALIEQYHPHMHRGTADYAGNFTTEELFPAADVLIADYSSLIYEYLLFDKPLVLYVPDFDTYQKKRGFYMNYDEIPGTVVKREADLAAAAARAASEPVDLSARKAFRAKYMSACDGHASERVADEILKWLEK